MEIREFVKHAKYFLLLLGAMFFIIIIMLTAANAHSAGEWIYDADCCDKNDCVPVDRIDRFDHYQIWHTKKYGKTRVEVDQIGTQDFFQTRASKDAKYHLCAFTWAESGKVETRIRCIYVPGTS